MTDIRQEFSFDSVDQPTLLARYQELAAVALSKGDDCPIDVLKEMIALCQVLRRRSSGPPKVARTKSLPTLDDL